MGSLVLEALVAEKAFIDLLSVHYLTLIWSSWLALLCLFQVIVWLVNY